MSDTLKRSRKDIVKEAAQGLLEMFRTGQMPEAVALTIIRRREGDDQPSFHWSIGNQILMLFQGTADARGFRQWQQVGRYVKQGARAIHILGPLTAKIKEVDEQTGEESEKQIITGFRGIPVFRLEDTDGEPLEKPDYSPPKLPPFWGVAEHLGIQVEYAPCDGGYYGSYSLSRDKITLCSQDEFVYYHELAHAVHGTLRELKKGANPEQEIVAETAAAVLCQLQGITGYESQTYQYIEEYAFKMKEQEVLKALMRVLGEVEAIVLRILEIAERVEPSKASSTA